TLTLTNTGIKPINVQIRVFRWSQADGVETLQPTKDVVASPPATSLTPGTDYTIRVLRIAKAPVAGEEAYRIFVDELPSPEPRNPDTVRLVLRYSIPVFFAAETTEQAKVAWGVTYGKGQIGRAHV